MTDQLALTEARRLRERLHRDLIVAMKARDAATVAALRVAIAAIDNAEAADIPEGSSDTTSAHIAGARAGVGSTEVARRALSIDEVRRILRAQIDERTTQAAEFERGGRTAAAEGLRGEEAALERYLEEADNG
jgi:uncharacterized protein YqeY